MYDALVRELQALRKRVDAMEALENSGGVLFPLTAPLTSTSWDGDSYSTTAKTLIDLSAVFSAPANVSAVLMKVELNDSGSAGTDTRIILAPNDTAGQGPAFSPSDINDRLGRHMAVIPCNSDGDIFYQIVASGASTMDVYLAIWGYWL